MSKRRLDKSEKIFIIMASPLLIVFSPLIVIGLMIAMLTLATPKKIDNFDIDSIEGCREANLKQTERLALRDKTDEINYII